MLGLFFVDRPDNGWPEADNVIGSLHCRRTIVVIVGTIPSTLYETEYSRIRRLITCFHKRATDFIINFTLKHMIIYLYYHWVNHIAGDYHTGGYNVGNSVSGDTYVGMMTVMVYYRTDSAFSETVGSLQ